MSTSSNDALIFDVFEGYNTRAARRQRDAISTACRTTKLAVTFDDNFWPTFALPESEVLTRCGVEESNVFYRLVMFRMSAHAAEFMAGLVPATFDDVDVDHRMGVVANRGLSERYESQRRYDGERHYLVQLMRAMLEAGVLHEMRTAPVMPDGAYVSSHRHFLDQEAAHAEAWGGQL